MCSGDGSGEDIVASWRPTGQRDWLFREVFPFFSFKFVFFLISFLLFLLQRVVFFFFGLCSWEQHYVMLPLENSPGSFQLFLDLPVGFHQLALLKLVCFFLYGFSFLFLVMSYF